MSNFTREKTRTVLRNEPTETRPSLHMAGWLLLSGQVLYILVTLLHAGGPANDHPAIFAAYAASSIWTAVHVAQFLCMSILLGGLLAFSFALNPDAVIGRWGARFGAALVVATLALYGAVLAVDGVALKQAVDAWAAAPDAERAMRFANAETVRWLEWGMRSYENFTLGLSILALAIAASRTARLPRAIPTLMGLSSVALFAQGWTAGTDGFSHLHELAIISSEVLSVSWMIWLLVAASRIERTDTQASA